MPVSDVTTSGSQEIPKGFRLMHPKIQKIALAGLLLLSLVTAVPAQTPQPAGTCARVKIQLSQDVAITRTAFRATLTIGNSPVSSQIKTLKVALDIRDSNSNPANAKFGISNPVLTGLSDVAGTGTIAPGASGIAVWTLLPTRDAAPLADTKYTVGGTISYTLDGVSIVLPLFPAPITVKPDPLLQFHYFLQHNVYGDDPFTPEVEPSEPFALGLLIVNAGAGTAHNLTITSSQPKIVDNAKQLQIAFQLLGASVNGQPASPSLTAQLGDIKPGKAADANFLLLSSLQGNFLSYSATFKHNDDLNNPRTSLIDSVDTYFLEHVVRIVTPSDDGRPDFLFFSADPPTSELNPVPDAVWNSDGTTSPVTSLVPANAVSDGPVTNANLVVHLVVPNVPSGFVYIRTADPGQNTYQLTSVTRSDGKSITLGDNAWTSHRIIRLVGQAPLPQNRLYLFDDNSTGAYTLTYAPVVPIKPTVKFTSPNDTDTFSPNTTISLTASAASVQTLVKEVDFYADDVPIAVSTSTPYLAAYQPAVGTHTLKAIAIDANGTSSNPAQITITVNALSNKPPVVNLTGPNVAADLFAPATVSVSAIASDPDGTVAKVDFYNNGQFFGSSITSPYVVTSPNLSVGSYSFSAIATDNQGAATASNSLPVQIYPALTATGSALIRAVSAVRLSTPGQMLITVQNVGGTNAVNLALAGARIKWGSQANPAVTPAVVSMLAPNSTTTFMLQFPAADTSKQLKMFGSFSGRGFSGFAAVTP